MATFLDVPAGVPTSRLPAQAEALQSVAHALVERDGFELSLERTLEVVVTEALAALPAVAGAGMSLLERGGTLTFHAPSDAVVASLARRQSDMGEGPAHDCLRNRAVVVADDLALADGSRWPRFTPTALQHDVGAVCSIPLVARDRRTAGTVNLYAAGSGTFDASCLATAGLIASHAALAVHAARRLTALHDALAGRDVIGAAKGILMERFGLTDQEAFDKLVKSSQDTNIKLRDIAAWLVNDPARGGPTQPTTT